MMKGPRKFRSIEDLRWFLVDVCSGKDKMSAAPGGLKHVATEPAQIGGKRERRRVPSGRAAALRRAPSDSDCSGETASLSADSAERAPRAPPTLNKSRSRRRGSEWEVLEGLKDGQRFEKRPEVFNGYLHKKRKWPLKGWHKRFFVIDGGILVYARSPTDVARGRLHGSVDVGLSVISGKQRRRRIDIDADEFIYHLRAKTPDVFRTWLLVLKAHRLYRQHLLTFGARESAPKVHVPLDDIPATDNSRTSKSGTTSFSTLTDTSMEVSTPSPKGDCKPSVQPTKPDTKNSTQSNTKPEVMVYNQTVEKPSKGATQNTSLLEQIKGRCSRKFVKKIFSGNSTRKEEHNEALSGNKQVNETVLETSVWNRNPVTNLPVSHVNINHCNRKKQVETKDDTYSPVLQDYKTYYQKFQKRHAMANWSQSSMKRSRKCTNVVKYRNTNAEPPLQQKASKCMLLAKYRIKDPIEEVFKKQKLDVEVTESPIPKKDTSTHSEFDEITDKLLAVFGKNAPIYEKDVNVKTMVGQAVQHLCQTKMSNSHPVQQLFKILLEYYFETSGRLKIPPKIEWKTNEVQAICDTKDASISAVCYCKDEKDVSVQSSPIKEKDSIPQVRETSEKELLIQKLEKVLHNTIYLTDSPDKTSEEITKILIENVENIETMQAKNSNRKSNSGSNIHNALYSFIKKTSQSSKCFLADYFQVLHATTDISANNYKKSRSRTAIKYQLYEVSTRNTYNKKTECGIQANVNAPSKDACVLCDVNPIDGKNYNKRKPKADDIDKQMLLQGLLRKLSSYMYLCKKERVYFDMEKRIQANTAKQSGDKVISSEVGSKISLDISKFNIRDVKVVKSPDIKSPIVTIMFSENGRKSIDTQVRGDYCKKYSGLNEINSDENERLDYKFLQKQTRSKTHRCPNIYSKYTEVKPQSSSSNLTGTNPLNTSVSERKEFSSEFSCESSKYHRPSESEKVEKEFQKDNKDIPVTTNTIDKSFIQHLLKNLIDLSKDFPDLSKDLNELYEKTKQKYDQNPKGSTISLLGQIYRDVGTRQSTDDEIIFYTQAQNHPIDNTAQISTSKSVLVMKKHFLTSSSSTILKTVADAGQSTRKPANYDTQGVSMLSRSLGLSKSFSFMDIDASSYPLGRRISTKYWYNSAVNTSDFRSSTALPSRDFSAKTISFIAPSKTFLKLEDLSDEKNRGEDMIKIKDSEDISTTELNSDEIIKPKEFKDCNLQVGSTYIESNATVDTQKRIEDELKSIYRCSSVPSICSVLVSPTAAIRGPQAGFVSGTPGGRLASWIIESGGPLENASKELGQAQLSVQQLQRLLDALELQQQVHHDTDVSLEGASPNVKKDRRKFGLRKKKSSSKCASIDLQPQHYIDPSNSHMALSALTAPPSPGGGASSVPNSAASLPIACAAARPQSLPGAEALGGGGPASLSSLTPDHQLREDFTVLAKDLVHSLKGIVGTLVCERGRLRAAMDAADPGAPGGAAAALRTSLASALLQNEELRTRLARIHDASDVAEMSRADPVALLQQSLSYSSSCVSASEFFDAEEHDDELKTAETAPEVDADEAGVIELDGDSSSEVGSLSSEEGSASSDNSDGALLTAEPVTVRLNNGPAPWTRRTCLPRPRAAPGGPSLWNLLYKNIGKDLSQISMPVTINEPLNMLQRLCEELEYSELLDAASECSSSVERMALVAAFAVSSYAAAAHRAASKPFNPLLGETYECKRDDRNFRFLAEQVSHHPPISACYAESPRWCLWQDARIKTKFWGKSMEFQPAGQVHLRLLGTGDHYSWNKVTTCVHNLFGGQRWVDQYGDMHITCHNSDITCKLNFVKASSWSTTRHEVKGHVSEPSTGTRLRLQGRWSEALHAGEPPANRCLWRPGAMPPEHELYYGFTRFAMELNELEPGMRETLPPTDTRLRPDQRALEEGDVESAERLKHQLEQTQRERRRDHPAHTPAWFRKSIENGEEMWVYNGEYWKAREEGFSQHKLSQLW